VKPGCAPTGLALGDLGGQIRERRRRVRLVKGDRRLRRGDPLGAGLDQEVRVGPALEHG
jgi:hypothetical protein